MRASSFDVFDTLLTRTCAEPHDLFLRVGERLAADRSVRLSPRLFAGARHRAERRARQRSARGEVTLAEIYAALAADLAWNDTLRQHGQAIEIALETEGIRPVPAMQPEVAQARREAGRVIFISDMYLPAAVIRQWLEVAGFWQPGDRLFISGEAGVCKSTGELFALIRAELGLDYKTWIHQGDHPISDHARPLRLGLSARHRPAGRLNFRERSLRGEEPFAPAWRTLLAGAARLARLDLPPAAGPVSLPALWETGTDVAGPLFYGFTDWCLEQATRAGLTDLFFLARGGQIFLRVATEIQARRPRNLRLHYLPVSRLALIGTVRSADLSHLRTLAAPTLAFHSARQAGANLGLILDERLAPAWLPSADWDRNLSVTERAQLADWLLDETRLPLVQAALRERRQLARAYLAQQGLASCARAGLVDTGWMGTIQHHMEIVLGSVEAPAPLAGFYLGLNPVSDFTCAGEMAAYSPLFSRAPLQRVHSPRVLVELMARADHGPVLRYETAGHGVIQPRLGPVDPAAIWEILLFQEAVLAFTRRVLDAGPELAGAPTDALDATVAQGFRRFHDRPTRTEALTFGRLPHSDQLLEQSYSILCPPLRPGEVLGAMLDRERRPACWWIEGQATLGPAPLLHCYLALKKIKWRLQSAFAKG